MSVVTRPRLAQAPDHLSQLVRKLRQGLAAVLRDHDEISRLPAEARQKEVDVFRRKWIYYFVYCEVGFTHRVINDHILAFTRENHTTLPVCSG